MTAEIQKDSLAVIKEVHLRDECRACVKGLWANQSPEIDSFTEKELFLLGMPQYDYLEIGISPPMRYPKFFKISKEEAKELWESIYSKVDRLKASDVSKASEAARRP